MLRILGRKRHKGGLGGVALRIEVRPSDVDQRQLDVIRRSLVAALRLLALDVDRRVAEDTSRCLRWRRRGEHLVLFATSDLSCHQAGSEVWMLVITLADVDPPIRDRLGNR